MPWNMVSTVTVSESAIMGGSQNVCSSTDWRSLYGAGELVRVSNPSDIRALPKRIRAVNCVNCGAPFSFHESICSWCKSIRNDNV